MKPFSPRGILLDVEGTTSSISFVHDVMFPWVREHLSRFLDNNWGLEEVQKCVPLLANDLGHSPADWPVGNSAQDKRKAVEAAVHRLMDGDVKATGLKALQGMVWKDGFESGQLVAHVYADVAPAIRSWQSSGISVRIYSSGSIAAQKLFFGHTEAGDLTGLFDGHYDTTTGPKKDASSYIAIATAFNLRPGEVLFVSDVVEELCAARSAGMQTLLSIRPGNATQPPHDFQTINSFAEILQASV